MEDVRPYTIAISKGAALVDETIAWLGAWSPGQSADGLARIAAESDVLGKTSAYRVRDIVRRVFAPRYLRPDESAAAHMKRFLDSSQSRQWICDVGLLFSCRADRLLGDARRSLLEVGRRRSIYRSAGGPAWVLRSGGRERQGPRTMVGGRFHQGCSGDCGRLGGLPAGWPEISGQPSDPRLSCPR